MKQQGRFNENGHSSKHRNGSKKPAEAKNHNSQTANQQSHPSSKQQKRRNINTQTPTDLNKTHSTLKKSSSQMKRQFKALPQSASNDKQQVQKQNRDRSIKTLAAKDGDVPLNNHLELVLDQESSKNGQLNQENTFDQSEFGK